MKLVGYFISSDFILFSCSYFCIAILFLLLYFYTESNHFVKSVYSSSLSMRESYVTLPLPGLCDVFCPFSRLSLYYQHPANTVSPLGLHGGKKALWDQHEGETTMTIFILLSLLNFTCLFGESLDKT